MSHLLDILYYKDMIKIFHWTTKSHAKHVASDKLHKDLEDLADKFIETYSGHFGREQLFAAPANDFKISKLDDSAILTFLTGLSEFADVFLRSKCGGKSDLANIVDEIVSTIAQGKYLLELS